MPDTGQKILDSRDRGEWLRLRTLIGLRWIAIAGQIAALLVAWKAFDVQLNVGLCAAAVGASVLVNIVAMFVYPENKRLSETEAILTQLFDISQLAFLLYLTGGLNNPFAVLLIVPVIISATALDRITTVSLGLVAAALVSVLRFYHQPLVIGTEGQMMLPGLFLDGFWIAILTGLVFLGAYARRVSVETHSMADALAATQMALAREQKLTDLGGVVAAAAHELGTPLATIKLVSSELREELADNPELAEDVRLIAEQADRCKEILHSMGRAGKEDLHVRTAPLGAVLREAAEPHMSRGKAVHFEIGPSQAGPEGEPLVHRWPEVIHGIRNLVQNAVDFAAANVWVTAEWTDRAITLRITDDGRGYPPELIGRIGDPFVRRRGARRADPARPEYQGMGLGLFIAKTLLERTGASLTFANASDPFLAPEDRPERCGAVVEVIWPMDRLALDASAARSGLGENRLIMS